MNKRGKLALSIILISVILISIFFLTNIKIAKSEAWQDWLTLEYNTEQCLAKCEAIFIITNPTNYNVVLGSNDFNVWHETFNGGGLTKPIEVQREETIEYYVTIPEYGTCYNQVSKEGLNTTCSEMDCIDQGTYCDCPYTCQTGSHQEQRTRKEYQPFSFSGKTLHANELWRIKLIGYKKPSLEKNDVEWLINFKGMQPPWDWWNASCDYRMYLNITENNATVLTNYLVNATIIATANLDNVDETRVIVNDTWETAFRWNTTTFTEGEPHVLWWNTSCSASSTCIDYLYYGCTGFSNAESDVSSYVVDTNHTKGYWLFDDSWNDESPNSYTLATGGNPTFAMGKYGSRAVVFDGDDEVNRNILVTIYPVATSMTIEMWIKPSSTLDASSSVLAFASHAMGGSADYTGWQFIHFGNTDAGKLGFGYGDGADYTYVNSVQTFNAGTWYHIAATFDGNYVRLYVNGNLVGEITDSTSILMNTVYDFTVGARRYASHTPSLFFTGTIDEVRYLNKSLNPNEFVPRAIEPITVAGPEEAYDTIPPTWSDPKTNGSNLTKNGDTIYFNITLKDNKTGGNYLFSIDDGTSNFVNYSQVSWTTPEEVQVIRTITAIKGQQVRWKWFFTDGAGNNNVTSIWSFIVANSPPTHSSPLLQATSVYNSSSDNLTCYNQSTQDSDGDEVINVYSWIKNSQSLAILNLPFEINADDYSSNDNDGIINGATFTTGKVGRALQFDGIDDYVKVEENFGTSFNSFSAEAWVNLKDIGTQHRYILERDDIHFYISIMPNKKVRFRHSDLTNGATETESNAIEFDEWTHIAVVYDGTKTYIYVNGQLKKEQDDTGTISFSATEQLYIGSSKYALSYPDRTWNGSIDEIRVYDYALSAEQVSAHYNLEYNKIVSQETTAGETYQCSVTPNDQEADGIALDSNPLTIMYKIIFNVTSVEQIDPNINEVVINCSYPGFDQGTEFYNPYGPYAFPPGNWECTFIKNVGIPTFFDKTITFTADADKTIDVIMSITGGLSYEEHTWLEALYNCIILEDCSLYNLLLEINSTVGNIWEHTKPTNENVVTFENITNKIVDSSHNLTIDYTVYIPIKTGYAVGTYLPVRIGFWFLDENNESCYDQGDRPTGVSEPFCQPLVIETIGPMDGSISFSVELQPELPTGDYNIKRIIDIDPDNVWINYGQEEIGTFTATENINGFGINLKTTSETTLEESVSTEEIASEEQVKEENLNNRPGIIGAVIGEIEDLFSNIQINILIISIMGLIALSIICHTMYKIKKLKSS